MRGFALAITGAQIRSVLQSMGAGTGTVAPFDQLAVGADAAMKRAGIKTLNAAAAFMATMAQESNYFRTTTEYGTGQTYAPYIGRTFQQLTWRDNYAGFGTWAKTQGLLTDSSMFVKNPPALSAITWAWLGGVYYWTAPRSWGEYRNLVQVADTGSILMVSRAVNAGNPFWTGTPNGMSTRQALFDAFKALGSSIVPGTATPQAPSTAPPGRIPGTGAQVVAAANALWNHPTMGKGRYYGNNWPGLKLMGYGPILWCAAFARLCFRNGIGWDPKGWCAEPASTDQWCRRASRDPLWEEVKYADARPGDVIFFYRTAAAARALDSFHVGIVENGPTAAGHDLTTIEGNTSTPGISQSMSSGGTLAKKTRSDLSTAYFHLRIWRPPYWTATTTTPPSTPVEEPEAPVSERPLVSTIDAPSDDQITQNPIEALQVSASFLANLQSSGSVRSRVTAWYAGQQTGPAELPLLANESTVKVSPSSPVRRNASLVFQEDMSDAELRDLYDLLTTPGIQLRAETGSAWGAAHEMVPVHTGLCDTVKRDWTGRRITVESPDLMALVAMRGFGGPVTTWDALTFPQTIAFFACEAVARSRLVDLTGNTDRMLSVIFDGTPTSRVDAVMECAQAIGAEVFASPAPERFVLRPNAALSDAARWTVTAGDDLISLTETTDWSQVANLWVVVSERADQAAVQGEYRCTTGPLAWDGPFGGRVSYFHTSLLQDREQCETAAKGLFDRFVGARVNVDWTMLRNPLAESGDRVTVHTDRTAYDLILDSFEVPLGNQRVTAAQARTLTTEGLS